jgi:uncharacterized protein
MALDYEVPADKRLLYWLGDKLIEHRLPIMAIALLVTAVFAYWSFQLKLVTSFGDLLPQNHPYIRIHNRFSATFGGANNIMVMLEVENGTIFTPETLNKIWDMTQGMDRVYGVNHNQVESIAHRTVRYLKVAAGGTMNAKPVMLEPVSTQEDADALRRIVHNAENIYGLLVSLDDKAAIIRANFIEGRLDFRRIFDEVNREVIAPYQDANTKIYAAGEPFLYGWVYSYAGDVFFILVVTYCLEWVLRWLYFHDWRGALRPTLTGLIAAFWGLGFIHLIGLALDPLMLVMPFLITARAVSHAIQQHDRYYEEFERCKWHKRRAIVASFAEMFVPTFSGIACDAFGVLVILLVPVVMLQKLAITASWWILAMTVAELLLNPIVYYYLKPPDPALVVLRDRGTFRKVIERFASALLSTTGRVTTIVVWAVGALVALYFLRGLTIGDPTSASPLLWEDSQYNVSHQRIQEKFGGVEPLIIVADGYDRDAMKEPHIIKTMESFQRYLERDPAVGYSFSLADILRGVNMVFHELQPKWGVIPDNWVDVGGLFFLYFAGSPPTETEKYVTSDYKTAHVTFFCKDHKGENVRRVVHRSKQFIFGAQLRDLGISVREEDKQVFISAIAAEPGWEKAGPSWIVSSQKTDLSPFKVGDRIVRLGKYDVTDLESFQEALSRATANNTLFDVAFVRDGNRAENTVGAPWKAAFKLAGGLIGVLAAANEELVRNDVLMNFLGFFTIWVILLFTYRSFACGFYLLAPLICSNMVVNAYMAANNIGVNIQTLPLVTVGVGFGIDYALYIVSRIIDEIRVRGDLAESVREALVTSGKAVTFTAIVMANSTAFWIVSRIRFNAEMGGLLALWMIISYLGSQTLLPVLILLFRPRFITREAGYYDPRQVQIRANRAKK